MKAGIPYPVNPVHPVSKFGIRITGYGSRHRRISDARAEIAKAREDGDQ
jgi:hypothetical protein